MSRSVNILEFNGAPRIAGNSANGAWCQGLNRVAWFEAERNTRDRQFDIKLHATKQESGFSRGTDSSSVEKRALVILSHEVDIVSWKIILKTFSDLYRDKKM